MEDMAVLISISDNNVSIVHIICVIINTSQESMNYTGESGSNPQQMMFKNVIG